MKSKGVLAIFAIFTICVGCQCEKPEPVPDHLAGLWKTTAPQYAGCFFKLEQNTITFGTAEGTVDTHSIKNMERERDYNEEAILYTIHYEDQEGEVYAFAFYYYPADDGLIKFKNQQQIAWNKEGTLR